MINVIESCEALVNAPSWDAFIAASPYAEKIQQHVKEDSEKDELKGRKS